MRNLQVALVFVFIILARVNASASCPATAAAHADAAYKHFAAFERLMFHDFDADGAIAAYETGARETGQARSSCPPVQMELAAKVLAITSAFKDLKATLELNAAPDNDKLECVVEHRDVAKSDVSEAWYGLYIVHRTRQDPPRLAHFELMTKMIASRLGVPLPAYSASADAAKRFSDRFQFSGYGNCFHNPEP